MNAASCDVHPLSILVGVTGHRDIPAESVAELESRVLSQLLQLRKHHSHCPLVVLSSLAEGADRLCARAALDAGCSLHVPLPMARKEYERDFNEASRQEFGELLSRADAVFVAEALEPMPQSPPPRGFFYRQAGLYMAKHAHVLIALWDGEETLCPEGGGTYETVCFMRQENGIICHIPTPRGSTLKTARLGAALWTGEDKRLACIEAFNQEGLKKTTPDDLAAQSKPYRIDADLGKSPDCGLSRL